MDSLILNSPAFIYWFAVAEWNTVQPITWRTRRRAHSANTPIITKSCFICQSCDEVPTGRVTLCTEYDSSVMPHYRHQITRKVWYLFGEIQSMTYEISHFQSIVAILTATEKQWLSHNTLWDRHNLKFTQRHHTKIAFNFCFSHKTCQNANKF